MVKKSPKHKPWTKMNVKELVEATRQFEKPIKFDDTRPLSPSEKADWEHSRRGTLHSTRVYNGKQKTIRIRIDQSLLKQFDEFAERNEMTRDEFIARSLRSAIAFVD